MKARAGCHWYICASVGEHRSAGLEKRIMFPDTDALDAAPATSQGDNRFTPPRRCPLEMGDTLLKCGPAEMNL